MDNFNLFMDILNSLIKEKGCSKTQMKKDLSLGINTFSNWKLRGTIPSGETLSKIANYFDVSVDYLLGNTEQREKPLTDDEELAEYLEELKNREELRMLFSLAKGATKADVQKAVKIVEAYLKD